MKLLTYTSKENYEPRLGFIHNNQVIDMEDFGNTVSSTIPIALKNRMDISANDEKILLAGFGVGYSWGALVIYNNKK